MALPDGLVLILVRWLCYAKWPRVITYTWFATGKVPDPSAPKTVWDKFLWRKLFDHNPLFVIASDRLACKQYVRARVPSLRFAKVLWTGNRIDDIPDPLLRGNVVLKANHASGRNHLIRDGNVDRTMLPQIVKGWLKAYGIRRGEWAYRNALRTIILEEMLLDNDGPASTEYKFHVCNGTTAYVFVQQRLISGGTTHFFADRDGRYVKAHPTDADQIRPLPTYFLEMRDVAEQLAEPFDFIRCDLYDLSGEFAFSELTVYPQSGTGNDGVRSLAELRNSSWDLRKSWLLTREQSGWRKRYATALVRWIERHATASSA